METPSQKLFVRLLHANQDVKLNVSLSDEPQAESFKPALSYNSDTQGVEIVDASEPVVMFENSVDHKIFEAMKRRTGLHTTQNWDETVSRVRIKLLGDESDIERGRAILSNLDCTKSSDVPESAGDNKPAKHPDLEKRTVFYRRAFGKVCGQVQTKSFLQLCERFQIFLSPKTRQEVFEPLFNEIKDDHLVSLRDKSKGVRRWLMFRFACKTLFMTVGCFRVMLRSKLAKLLLSFIPESVRRFFSS